jgi:hypothetical protein
MPVLNGSAILSRLKDGDLDSVDVGDFLDRYLGGEDASEGDLPVLDIVARDFLKGLVPILPKGGTCEIWRMVVVSGDADTWASNPVGPGGIGVSWSFDPSGAAPYGGGYESGVRRMLRARVTLEDIDFAASCIMNAVKPEQHECRLLYAAHVEVIGIYDGRSMERLECPCAGMRFQAHCPEEAHPPGTTP